MNAHGASPACGRIPGRSSGGVLFCSFLFLSFFVHSTLGQVRPATEYPLKAAFILKFLPLVEWPKEAFQREDAPLVVAVLGEEDPFEGTLERILQGQIVHGRGVEFRHFRSMAELADCQVLFVCRSERDRIGTVVGRVQDRSILTIGDTDGFGERGLIVNFFIQEGKMRFEINVSATRKAGLTISSKLLRLAKMVEEAQP